MSNFLFSIICFFLLFFANYAIGQEYVLKGKVVNQYRDPLSFISISLLKDGKQLIGQSVTDSSGVFSFKATAGNYLLIFEQFGEEYDKKDVVLSQNCDFKEIIIDKSVMLKGVTITSKKKLIEQKVDRLVFNVENSSASQGMTGLDVLRNTPLVRVQNESVSIVGKGGVLVMIDDRLQRLSSEDLASLLKSISSDNIKSVEVITTPPAKYDAEGSNGLINIVLKKGRKDSWSASLGSSYIQKRNGGGGLNGVFNYNYKKLSINLSLSGSKQKLLTDSESNIFYPGDLWNLNVKNNSVNNNLSTGIGADYKITKNWTTGIKYLGSFTDNNSENSPLTSRFTSGSGSPYSYVSSNVMANNNPKMNSVNWFNSVNIDSLGATLTTDFDYFNYRKTDMLSTKGNELGSDMNTLPSTYFSTTNNNVNKIKNYSGKVDVEMPKSWGKLSFGGKFSFTQTDNDLSVYNNESGTPNLDINQSNFFNYKEYNEALYVSYNKKLSKQWDLQLGLRMEATQTTGYSRNTQQTNKNDYIKLFPTVFVTYTPHDNHSFSFNYSKRIVRPSFDYLNPFIVRSNPYYYTEGNPFLKPMIQDNIELSYLYKEQLGISVYYNIVAGFAQRVSIGDPQTNITRSIPLNYANSALTGFSAYYIYNKLKWWNSFTGFNVNYNNIKSKSEYIKSIGDFNGYFYSNNDFFVNKSKNLSFSANFWVQPKGLNQIFYISTFAGLDLSLKLLLLNKKLVLTAGIEDLFNSQIPTYTYYTNSIKNTIRRYNDTRGFRLSLTYRFGNKNIDKAQRKLGNEEEKRRAN
ncbi:TonB-dependent receptor [Elizabethkingia ursingii]|uniref:TonB-dependent receptor n=1 Tax=Elizabethkingia ursingii TaxID=1756150 RepID=UPI002012447A|nr:TonB-dependent receptor [Elizabethkingia ursingii]MCL1665431.1 TonB-dependent receptor [Elizabethkingia ursingii]